MNLPSAVKSVAFAANAVVAIHMSFLPIGFEDSKSFFVGCRCKLNALILSNAFNSHRHFRQCQ